MAVITSYSLVGALTSASAPYIIGHTFKKGDVPAGSDVLGNGTAFQCIPKNYWSDGSLKFARIAGRIATTAGAPVVVTLATGTAAAGAALTITNLKATGLTVTFGAGAFGSATFSGTDFDTFQKQTDEGPVMSCWRFRKQIGSDPHLVAWMEVSLFTGGVVEVFPWFENGYLTVDAPTNKNETFTVSINGATVFNYATDFTTHMRMVAINGTNLSYWVGVTDPQISLILDTAYMESTRIVPTYRHRTPSTASTITALPSTYVPFQRGDFAAAMGAGGATPSIGIITNADALYITCPNQKTYGSTIRHGFSAGRYGIHYRDELTNEPARPSLRPNLVLNGSTPNIGGIGLSSTLEYTPAPGGTSRFQYRVSHHPSLGFMAYLLTGRYYFIEETQFAVAFAYLQNSTFERETFEWIVRPEAAVNTTRGTAWVYRSMVQAAALSPDGDTVGEELRTSWINNVNHMCGKYITLQSNPRGFTHIYTDYGVAEQTGIRGSGFQADFFTAAIGYSMCIEVPMPAPTKTKLDEFFVWKAQSIIGRLGGFGPTEWPYTQAAFYEIPVGPNQKLADTTTGRAATVWDTDPTGPWHADWGVCYTNAFGTAPKVDGPLANYDFGIATGYWANLVPAIAYAVEHAVPGADAAYARLTGASNWNMQETTFINTPVYGIKPSSAAAYVPPDPAPDPDPVPDPSPTEPIIMPIAFTDIKLRQSGASGLGGVISATDIGSNMFDDVQGPEAVAGRTEYRCAYVYNAHPTDTMTGAVAWLAANTPSISTIIEIGLGAAAMNATEQTVASEISAPLGVSFVAGDTKATGVALGDIPPLGFRSVWYRRTTAPGTTARASDTWTPRVESGGG